MKSTMTETKRWAMMEKNNIFRKEVTGMIRLATAAVMLVLLTGCSQEASKQENTFESPDLAMEYGLKEEGLTKDAVVSLLTENNETFVFYKKEVEDGLALGVSTIYAKDQAYVWDDGSADVQLIDNATGKHIHVVSWELKSGSGSAYKVYSGISDETNQVIETNQGTTTPVVDEKTGILAYVEMAEK